MSYKFYIEALNKNGASIKQYCIEQLTERLNQLKLCLDECESKKFNDKIIDELRLEFQEIQEALNV